MQTTSISYSQQASHGRHLAPVAAPYVWRAIVWEERFAGSDVWPAEWRIAFIFDMACQLDAEHFALDACTEPWEPGVTGMHYVIGEVAA